MQLPVVLAFATAAAAGTLTVTNYCKDTVYGWNVVDTYGSDTPTFTLPGGSGKSWSSSYQSKSSDGGGASVKVQKTNNIFRGDPQNQIEYKMTSDTLFYDFSNINGNCFQEDNVVMRSSNSNCPQVLCPPGKVCNAAYNMPDDVRTLACPGDSNLEVVFCEPGSGAGSAAPAAPPSSSSKSSTSSSVSKPKAPAPSAPKPTPPVQNKQAQPSSAAGNNFLQEHDDKGKMDVVVATTLVEVYRTVTVAGPAPTGDKKREAHAHQHAHRGRSRYAGRHVH